MVAGYRVSSDATLVLPLLAAAEELSSAVGLHPGYANALSMAGSPAIPAGLDVFDELRLMNAWR